MKDWYKYISLICGILFVISCSTSVENEKSQVPDEQISVYDEANWTSFEKLDSDKEISAPDEESLSDNDTNESEEVVIIEDEEETQPPQKQETTDPIVVVDNEESPITTDISEDNSITPETSNDLEKTQKPLKSLPEIGTRMPLIVEAGHNLEKLLKSIFPNSWNKENFYFASGKKVKKAHLGDVIYFNFNQDSMQFVKYYEARASHKYMVQKGDTLSHIAYRLYGVSYAWRVLWRVNQIKNPDLIYVGQEIKYYTNELALSPTNPDKKAMIADVAKADHRAEQAVLKIIEPSDKYLSFKNTKFDNQFNNDILSEFIVENSLKMLQLSNNINVNRIKNINNFKTNHGFRINKQDVALISPTNNRDIKSRLNVSRETIQKP